MTAEVSVTVKMKLKAYQPDVETAKHHFTDMADGKHIRKQRGYGGSRLGPRLQTGGYTTAKRVNNASSTNVNLVTPTAMAVEEAKSSLRRNQGKGYVKKRIMRKKKTTQAKKKKRKVVPRKKKSTKSKKRVKTKQKRRMRRSDNFT